MRYSRNPGFRRYETVALQESVPEVVTRMVAVCWTSTAQVKEPGERGGTPGARASQREMSSEVAKPQRSHSKKCVSTRAAFSLGSIRHRRIVARQEGQVRHSKAAGQ